MRGTIAMARTNNPHSATAQFFINVVDNPNLDRNQEKNAAYTVFGKVVEGMDTVDKIKNTKCNYHPKYRSDPRKPPVTPVEPVVIKSVKVTRDIDRDKLAAAAKESVEKAKQASGAAIAPKQ